MRFAATSGSTTSRDRPEITDAEFDAPDARARRARERASRSSRAPTRRRGASAARRPRGSRRSMHARPMLSLENAYSWEEARGLARPRRRGCSAASRAASSRSSRSTGCRIVAALRERAARCAGRRAATATRGDDVTANVRTIRTIPLRDPGDVAARGPRRGLLLEEGVREGQRRSARRRASRSSPTRATPRRGRCACSTRGSRRGGASTRGSTASSRPPPLPARQSEALERLERRSAFPVNPHWRRCETFEEVRAFVEEWQREAARARVRDRRRRHQGRRPRDPGGARRDGEVAALGARLQVPGRGGDDDRARHRRQRRPHRRADARRALRPGAARRHDGQARDAAQLRGPVAQGRARRRHRRRRERAATSSPRSSASCSRSGRRAPSRSGCRRTVPSAAIRSCGSPARSRRAASIPPARPSCARRCATSAGGAR